MGLDMYLIGRKYIWKDFKHPENNRTEDGFKIREIHLDLGYWRKHPNLHGYIVDTFADGKDKCQEIDLDEEAIADIMKAIKDNRLPHTSGFFFGQSDGTKEERKQDLEVFERALNWMNAKPEPKHVLKKVGELPVPGGGLEFHEINITSDWPTESRSIFYVGSW